MSSSGENVNYHSAKYFKIHSYYNDIALQAASALAKSFAEQVTDVLHQKSQQSSSHHDGGCYELRY